MTTDHTSPEAEQFIACGSRMEDPAITDTRKYVGANFDKEFLPPAAIVYKAKTKNAQEAHEAVRPTSVTRSPEAVKSFLTHDQARLYELIWKRTVAAR